MLTGPLAFAAARTTAPAILACAVLALPSAAAAAGRPRWVVEPTPNRGGGTDSQLLGASCASRAVCTAVGYSTTAAGAGRMLAERWARTTGWSIEQTPSPRGANSSYLSGVSCPSPRVCTAVGYVTVSGGIAATLVERRDGGTWRVQRSPNPRGATDGHLVAVSCASTKACTAVGSYTNPFGAETPLAERWNGTRWTIQPVAELSGTAGATLRAVSCASPSDCTAVGALVQADGSEAALALGWNGSRWTVEPGVAPTLATYSQLASVACPSAGSCTAVGAFAGGGGADTGLAARWDGISWSVEPTPRPDGARASDLFGVSCGSAGTCAAVGNFAGPTGAFVALTERADRAHWKIERAPEPRGARDGGLDGVSCATPRLCTAVGYFIDRRGVKMPLVERYS